MMLFEIPLLMLALVATQVLVLALLGRVLVVVFGAKQGRSVLLNPLAGVMVALGVWLGVVMVCLAVGGKIQHWAWGFVGTSVLLSLWWVKAWPGFKGRELDWVLPFGLAALVWAVWGMLGTGVVTTVHEFLVGMTVPAGLLVGETTQYVGTLPGVWLGGSLVWFGLGVPIWESPLVWQGLLLILVVGAMLQATQMRLRWSNLPLLAAGGLLGVTVLNPWFGVGMVNQLSPLMLGAAGMLVLCLPLLQPVALPRGLGVIPVALAAAVVACTAPELWGVLLVVWGLWGLRQGLEGVPETEKTTTALGWGVLGLLPVMMVLGWQVVMGGEVWPSELPVGWGQRVWPGVNGLVISGLAVWVGWRFLQKQVELRVWVLQHFPLLVPVGVGLSAWAVDAVGYAQFVLLVPLWRLWLAWYEVSALKQRFYQHPWGYGGPFVLAVFGLSWVSQAVWQEQTPQYVRHAQQVARVLEETMRVGTVGPSEPNGVLAGAALQFYGGQTPLFEVRRVDGLFDLAAGGDGFGGRAIFHSLLQQAELNYVWVYGPGPREKAMFLRDLRSDTSYLFEITSYRFQLVQAFPHYR